MIVHIDHYTGGTALLAPERQRVHSDRIMQLLQDNITLLRAELLKRMLIAPHQDACLLEEELRLYGIPFRPGERCSLLCVRLDEGFRGYGSFQDAALAFSIQNIAEEHLCSEFRIWSAKDNYGHLIFMAKRRGDEAAILRQDGERTLELTAERIRSCIQTYLKGKASIAISPRGIFPDQLHTMYRSALTALRQYEAAGSESLVSAHTLVERVQAYIRNHLSEDISLQSLSEQVYLHPVYLSALYKSRTGEGLSEYIMRVKMEHAAKLLLSDSASRIYEVARKTGYRNQSYFSKVFKDRFGLTPLEYRKVNASYALPSMKPSS